MAGIPKDAEVRAKKLRELVEHHRKLYHEKDSPEISDEAYDSLIRELSSLEETYPSLKTEDTPTERVGGDPIDGFQKIEHERRQWSFDNVFDDDELREWEERMECNRVIFDIVLSTKLMV